MKSERRFHGVPVSPGIARGAAYIFRHDEDSPPHRVVAEPGREIERLREAMEKTRLQIAGLRDRVAESVGLHDAEIFDAHLMIVDDGVVLEEVEKMMQAERCNAEHAFHVVSQRYVKVFTEMDDSFLRERAIDIVDVSRRVIHNLMGREQTGLLRLDSPHVVFAPNLTPGDTAQMNRSFVLGFGTEAGGKVSHTAIMARSLNLPAVVGLHDFLDEIENGDPVLLDGYGGLLIVNPADATLFQYGELERRCALMETELTRLRESEAATQDGRRVLLSANIETDKDLEQVLQSGAEGVGLLRTEFLYLGREDFPSEQEQAEAYGRVAAAVKPQPVIIRTLDLGGDKLHDVLHAEREENPFLGWRAIRVCLERPDLFKSQLRAILRASTQGLVKVMFPMISGMMELRAAKRVLEECRAELLEEGVAFDPNMKVGMMIEIPSAAVTADLFAREVDFFSLGTNDLVQYTVAADRGNEHIAHLYEPTHPAVLRLIKQTVDAGRGAGIWTGVCGEMGGDLVLTPLLIGLGIENISCGAAVLPRVKRAVQSLTTAACEELVKEALACPTGREVLTLCEEVARAHYPELL